MSVDKWREPLYLYDTLVDGLQGLMLAHVIDHFSMGPAPVLSQSSPVVVVLSGATYIPGESQSVTMGPVGHRHLHHVVNATGTSEHLSSDYVMNLALVSFLRSY
jgi:hypothetical protein